MRFDGFQYGSRIDLVPSETPERRRLTQNQQTPQERCETSNRRRSAANTQADRIICSQKCTLLRATSCIWSASISAWAHALRSPLFRARLSHTNCSHGRSEHSSSSVLSICLYASVLRAKVVPPIQRQDRQLSECVQNSGLDPGDAACHISGALVNEARHLAGWHLGQDLGLSRQASQSRLLAR